MASLMCLVLQSPESSSCSVSTAPSVLFCVTTHLPALSFHGFPGLGKGKQDPQGPCLSGTTWFPEGTDKCRWDGGFPNGKGKANGIQASKWVRRQFAPKRSVTGRVTHGRSQKLCQVSGLLKGESTKVTGFRGQKESAQRRSFEGQGLGGSRPFHQQSSQKLSLWGASPCAYRA